MSLKDLFDEAYKKNSRKVDDFDIANGEYLQEALSLLAEAGLQAEIQSATGQAVYLRVTGAERQVNEWVGLRYNLKMDGKARWSCYFAVESGETEHDVAREDGRRALAADIVTYVAARKATAEHREALARVFSRSVTGEEGKAAAVRFSPPGAVQAGADAPWQDKVVESLVRVVRALNAAQEDVSFALRSASNEGEFYVSFQDARRPRFYGSISLSMERGPFYKAFAPQVRAGWRERTQAVRGPQDDGALQDFIARRAEKQLVEYDAQVARQNKLKL